MWKHYSALANLFIKGFQNAKSATNSWVEKPEKKETERPIRHYKESGKKKTAINPSVLCTKFSRFLDMAVGKKLISKRFPHRQRTVFLLVNVFNSLISMFMIFCGFGLMLLSQMILRNHATLLKRAFLLLTSTHFSMTTCGKNEFLKRSGKPKHQKTNIANSEWFAWKATFPSKNGMLLCHLRGFLLDEASLSQWKPTSHEAKVTKGSSPFLSLVPCRGSWMLFLLARSRPLVDHSPSKRFTEETGNFGPKSRELWQGEALGAFGFSFWVAFM